MCIWRPTRVSSKKGKNFLAENFAFVRLSFVREKREILGKFFREISLWSVSRKNAKFLRKKKCKNFAKKTEISEEEKSKILWKKYDRGIINYDQNKTSIAQLIIAPTKLIFFREIIFREILRKQFLRNVASILQFFALFIYAKIFSFFRESFCSLETQLATLSTG